MSPRAVVLIAALAAACAVPYEPTLVAIEATAASYRPADSVRVRLENVSGDALGYSHCSTYLERKEFTPTVHFVTVVDVSPAGCPASLAVLTAGRPDTIVLVLPGELGTGIYRFRFDEFYREGVLLPAELRSSHTFGVQ